MTYVRKKLFFGLFFLCVSCFFVSLPVNAQPAKGVIADDLQCCQMINPEGIDLPLLSWKIKSSAEGVSQQAWEVEIATTKDLLIRGKADVWKSGKRVSDEQFDIAPEVAQFADAGCYYWHVRIWDNLGRVSRWSNSAYFSIGLRTEQSWKAQWITYPYSKDSALPYFRKVFHLEKEPVKAHAYFCGLGAGELYLNGQKIDQTRFLDPAQTNYERYALYSTFDVTDRLKKGDNCLGVMLGNGRFTEDRSWKGAPFSYGSPMLRLQLVVRYSDGSTTIIGSDESWRWKRGPVLQADVYMGEIYDARCETKGWCEANTPSLDWKKAILAHEGVPPSLVPQLVEPIRTMQKLEAVEMWQDPSGNWIFDFGVNVAGIPLLKVNQTSGTVLTIRVAEAKNEDGSLDFTSTGWSFHGKIFEDKYICKGKGEEQWSPRFTYHGFRYAELSGMKTKPDLFALSLVPVRSDLPVRGTFECSNPQINRLHELAMRTITSNFVGIPTGCTNREKDGWLGDTHAYVKMANINLQMNNFWTKYLNDIRSSSLTVEENALFHERLNTSFYHAPKPSGLPYMVSPGKRTCGVASPVWGSALVQHPWWLYVYYGNKKVLKDFYPNMKQWVDYVSSLAGDTTRTNKYNRNTKHIIYQGLGDWAPPGGNAARDTPIEFVSTAFHYLDVCILVETACLLEKNDDAQRYKKKGQAILEEMTATLYNAREKTFGSQGANVLALDFGLVPKGDEKAVADAIVRNMIEKSDGFMHCGIYSLSRIGSILARNGKAEAAWNMFTKKGENSFSYMWEVGDATSLWEVLPVNKISQQSGRLDSQNQPMQAGYDITFFEDIAGIAPDSSGFGFKVIRFDPLFTDYLSWAKASIETPYGKAISSWEKEGDQYTWQITIPANSSGLVALQKGKNITVNGVKLDESKYFPVKSSKEKQLHYFPSGSFCVQVR